MSGERERDALTWLSFALGDLVSARSRGHTNARPRIVAFHAQQAAEKSLKAALVLDGIEPPRTHDLEQLRGLLPANWIVKRRPADLARLSRYGVDSRYPENLSLVSPLESATAVRQAMSVVRLVREGFERRGVSTDGLPAR